MKQAALLLAVALIAGACGDDDQPQQPDGGQVDAAVVDAPIDGPITPTTLTSFTIDLILNQTNNSEPKAFADFATLPDPDGTMNNTAAYSALF